MVQLKLLLIWCASVIMCVCLCVCEHAQFVGTGAVKIVVFAIVVHIVLGRCWLCEVFRNGGGSVVVVLSSRVEDNTRYHTRYHSSENIRLQRYDDTWTHEHPRNT